MVTIVWALQYVDGWWEVSQDSQVIARFLLRNDAQRFASELVELTR